jgi:hypothetical protein
MGSQLRFHSSYVFHALARRARPEEDGFHRPGVGAVPARPGLDNLSAFRRRASLAVGEWIKMAAAAAGARDSAEDLAIMASATVIASIAIEGRPECVGAARSFVAGALGDADRATGDAGRWLGGPIPSLRTPRRLGCRTWPR